MPVEAVGRVPGRKPAEEELDELEVLGRRRRSPAKTKNGLVPYPAAIERSGAFWPRAPLMQSKSRVWTFSRFDSGAGNFGFSSEPSGRVTSKTS